MTEHDYHERLISVGYEFDAKWKYTRRLRNGKLVIPAMGQWWIETEKQSIVRQISEFPYSQEEIGDCSIETLREFEQYGRFIINLVESGAI